MLVVELSNHPADMLDEASRRRETVGKRALSRYEDELVQHRARVQTVRVKRDRARAQHRWGVWLRLVVAAWTEKRRVARPQDRPIPKRYSRALRDRGEVPQRHRAHRR